MIEYGPLLTHMEMSGTASNRLVNIEKAAYAAVRIVFQPTGATGSLSATLNAKII